MKEKKSNAGRPPYFKTVEEMESLIDNYFQECDGEILKDPDGYPILDKYDNPIMLGQKPYTITGLTLALGFTSRQSLLNYQGKKEFMDAITRAKLRVEEYANIRTFDKEGVQGAKFTLINNFEGYKEKKDIEHSGELSQVVIVDDISKLKR